MPFDREKKAAYNREWRKRQKTGEVRSTRYDTGKCAVCGKGVFVRRDGKAMGHRPDDARLAFYGDPKYYCRGTDIEAIEVVPREQ